MSSSKKTPSNKKRESTENPKVVVKDEISCQILYTHDSTTSLSINTISVNHNILKILSIKNGSYIFLTSQIADCELRHYIFQVWASSLTSTTSNNANVIISKKLKSNFQSDTVTLNTKSLATCRILPCACIDIIIDNISQTNKPTSLLKEYIKTVAMNSIIIHDLKLDITWQGLKILVYLKPNISNTINISDNDISYIDRTKIIAYQIHIETIFNFQKTKNENLSRTDINNMKSVMLKPAGYDKEISITTQFLYTGLGLIPPIPPSSLSLNNNNSTSMFNTINNKEEINITSKTMLPNIFIESITKPPRGLLIKASPGAGKTYMMKYLISQLVHNNNNNNSDCHMNNDDFKINENNNIINHPKIHIYEITPTILLHRNVGEMENKINKIFQNAIENAPCCLVFDDIDLIAPPRTSDMSDSQKRLVSCLLRLIDQTQDKKIIFIATSSRPNNIEKALRRPGRFDTEIELEIPNNIQRIDILMSILQRQGIKIYTQSLPNESKLEYNTTSDVTYATAVKIGNLAHGYVAADLVRLVKEAILIHLLAQPDDTLPPSTAISSSSSSIQKNQTIFADDDDDGDEGSNTKNSNRDVAINLLINEFQNVTINNTPSHSSSSPAEPCNLANNSNSINNSMQSLSQTYLLESDIFQAVKYISPSAIRDIVVEIPSVKWTDIGGMESVKNSLKEVVEWPLLYADLFLQLNISPPRGVLLYGPPGCSKTLMAKALATESSLNFLSVRGPELLSKWLGESEKAVQTLFRRARSVAPCVIFFDEIDAFATKRGDSSAGVNDRVLSQLLTEIDISNKLDQSVIIIAATNRPDLLDAALLRPGRFDRKIYVSPPDSKSREQILRLEFSKLPLNFCLESSIETLVSATHGFSGAELVSICQEATMIAIDEECTQICLENIVNAIKDIKPQITEDMIEFYENLSF